MSNLAHLTELIGRATSALSPTVPEGSVVEWSELVYECMSGQARKYHDVRHVFNMSATTDPLEVLAAAFHDTIYYQVDGGLPGRARARIGNIVQDSPQGMVLDAKLDNRNDALVAAVFGFEPGQSLSPATGLNEFLSALLAVRCLAPVLSAGQLAQVSACIEATIPFRPSDSGGKSARERLFDRLCEASNRFDLDMSIVDVERAVLRAVDLSNRDVANFADNDVAHFLDDTWELLPESNNALRSPKGYTVAEYRSALHKMYRFFKKLDPDLVFTSFRGHPNDTELSAMTRVARRNIDVAYRYVSAKLATASMLLAIAELSGGDAPVALFMGALPWTESASSQLTDLLPAVPVEKAGGVAPEVLELLVKGRSRRSGFDLTHAPLTAFVYSAMGDPGTEQALRVLFDEKRDWLSWLLVFPHSVIDAVLAGCKEQVAARRELLGQLESSMAAHRAARA